ncbi:MAG: TonB family protein [Flavobacteriales bacterium]|nr:TonB family protein [Flavobacteriales bacterium]
MSEMIYIKDDFGNQIPLLDNHGNLSMHVVMLYTEDKLAEADRKAVDDFAATDEMSRDALDGYAVSSNASKTRHHLGTLNEEIQKISGAEAVSVSYPKNESQFDYRKLAAAIALLIVVGGGTFYLSRYLGKDELASNDEEVTETVIETVAEEAENAERISETTEDAVVVETSLSDSEDQGGSTRSANAVQEQAVPEKAKQEDRKPKETENPKKEEKKLDQVAQASAPSPKSKEVKPIAESDSELAAVNEPRSNSDKAKDLQKAPQQGAVAATGTAEKADSKLSLQQELEMAMEQGRLEAERAMQEREQQARSMEIERKASVSKSEDETAYTKSSVAKYSGGDIAMYKFIEKKKNYTEAMRAQNLRGSVTVIFDIEPDGRVANARIKSGENGILNEDALRVVRSMPKWKAATDQLGADIKSSRSVVITYGDN